MSGSADAGPCLDTSERATLLAVARASIAARLRGEAASLPPAPGGLGRRRGAFVTLHRRADGGLRGCVGMMRSDESLLATVARMAGAAALEDGRFEPVTEKELPTLRIEISALSPPVPIRPENVVVGRHGLLVERGGRRGVLLPQVPVEHGWDRETFLDSTCRKAGLPPSAWRDAATELLAFTAEVFGE